jgi:hypothetical protein
MLSKQSDNLPASRVGLRRPPHRGEQSPRAGAEDSNPRRRTPTYANSPTNFPWTLRRDPMGDIYDAPYGAAAYVRSAYANQTNPGAKLCPAPLTTLGNAGSSPAPTSCSAVAATLDNQLSYAFEALEMLERRLTNVLEPRVVETGGPTPPSSDASHNLVGALQDAYYRLERLTMEINRLANRVNS